MFQPVPHPSSIFGIKRPRARIQTATDPNRDADWDWTINEMYTLYTTGGEHFTVRLPYFSDTSPVRQCLGQKDVMPNDGWVLLYRDFGTSTEGTELPRYFLYNIYSGTMRFFYFNYKIDSPFSAAFVRLWIANTGLGQSQPALFTFYAGDILSYDYLHNYVNHEEYLTSFNPHREVVGVTQIAYREWCYVDFYIVGYDPDLSSTAYQDAAFAFDIVGVNEFTLSAGGSISLSPLYEHGTSNILTDFSSFISKIPAGEAANFIKSFGTTKEANQADQQRAQSAGNGQLAADLVSLAATAVGSYLPALGGLAGFIGGLIGGGTSERLIEYQGAMSIKGSLSQSAPVLFAYLRIPGVLHSANDALPIRQGRMGVFNLLRRPQFRWLREEDSYYPDPFDPRLQACDVTNYLCCEPIDYVTNPSIPGTSISVEAAYCSIGPFSRIQLSPVTFGPIEELPKQEWWYTVFQYSAPTADGGYLGTGIVVRIVIQPPQSVNQGRPVYIYKTFVPENGL